MSPPESTAEAPIINITGEKVALGPIRRDLLPLYLRWINDFDVVRTLGLEMGPVTMEAQEAWYERTSQGSDVVFTVYEIDGYRPIGNSSLGNIDRRHRTAVFGILIGDKASWGRGYGTETTRLVLDYGFTILGLHSIMLRVYSYNERGIRAYKRAGFQTVGRVRESFRLAGKAYDTILMDCLSTDFQSPNLHARIAPVDPT